MCFFFKNLQILNTEPLRELQLARLSIQHVKWEKEKNYLHRSFLLIHWSEKDGNRQILHFALRLAVALGAGRDKSKFGILVWCDLGTNRLRKRHCKLGIVLCLSLADSSHKPALGLPPSGRGLWPAGTEPSSALGGTPRPLLAPCDADKQLSDNVCRNWKPFASKRAATSWTASFITAVKMAFFPFNQSLTINLCKLNSLLNIIG